jgi:hypothetical protein
MSHLVAHFVNIEPINIGQQFLSFILIVFFYFFSPHLLCDQAFLVNGIEENQNTTT